MSGDPTTPDPARRPPDPDITPRVVVVSGQQLFQALAGQVEEPPAETEPSRLLWADELEEGAVIDTTGSCSCGNRHPSKWASILRLRNECGVVSAILVDDTGEQRAAQWQIFQAVRVRA